VTLRIGVDMDGVFADMNSAIHREAAAAFGAAPAAAAAPLTARQQRQLWKRVQQIDNFWESLEEIEPGVVARLWSLAEQRRWEVIFLTKRPESAGRTAQLQSHLWLQRHGFVSPAVFVVQGSRGKIAAALDLDLVVDDTAKNCVDVLAESRAKAVLISRDADERTEPSGQRLGIRVLRSVAECLDILDGAGGPPTSRAHVLQRMMRRLGLGGRPERPSLSLLADLGPP
jgi:hypothetical protein